MLTQLAAVMSENIYSLEHIILPATASYIKHARNKENEGCGETKRSIYDLLRKCREKRKKYTEKTERIIM